jgi:predicted Holliday junction resolvase-like endonuclease
MGFLVCLISMVIVFALMLPVIGFMLFDINSAKQEVRYEAQKIEQLLKQIEKEKEK